MGSRLAPRNATRAVVTALFLLLLSACHISINSKYGAFARDEAVAKKAGMDYGGGSGVSVGHFAGLTYSKSVAYIVGNGIVPNSKPLRDASFAIAGGDSLKIEFYHYSSHCIPDAATYAEFKRIAIEILQPIRVGMPTGVVHVYLVPESVGIAKEHFAVKTGFGIDLDFYYPCDTANVDRSAFAGFLDVTHELTHIVVGLQRLPVSGEAGEALARGGPACVYEILAEDDPAHLAKLLDYNTYFRSDPLYRETDGPPNTHVLCKTWKSKLE